MQHQNTEISQEKIFLETHIGLAEPEHICQQQLICTNELENDERIDTNLE